ncbi:hypothetical protein Plhal304r1_c012g0046011 [Plasmopara halstedii]
MTLNSKNVVERLKIAPEILKIVCLRQIILCELQLTGAKRRTVRVRYHSNILSVWL